LRGLAPGSARSTDRGFIRGSRLLCFALAFSASVFYSLLHAARGAGTQNEKSGEQNSEWLETRHELPPSMFEWA
jgi:hypothetical protein